MRIAIASGKGGTGKTTLATNLAALLAGRGVAVRLLDADVEEPVFGNRLLRLGYGERIGPHYLLRAAAPQLQDYEAQRDQEGREGRVMHHAPRRSAAMAARRCRSRESGRDV